MKINVWFIFFFGALGGLLFNYDKAGLYHDQKYLKFGGAIYRHLFDCCG
ncbi:hypothetical protein H7R52_00565 [Weissella confusa]|uniref:Uncharacterized protein n=1 Tax=Weissella confusa TaxID=1583 RepID=A0A923NE72_WEICO|nr:hypothetical protein [Weissella confusa]